LREWPGAYFVFWRGVNQPERAPDSAPSRDRRQSAGADSITYMLMKALRLVAK
jgi:hypothetical protein